MARRFPLSSASSGRRTPPRETAEIPVNGTRKASDKTTSKPRPAIRPPYWSSSYPFGGVFLGDLVVKKAGGVRRRHQAAVDLGIDAGVLKHLPVRHFDFQRAAFLVVADRAQLGGINPLALHLCAFFT